MVGACPFLSVGSIRRCSPTARQSAQKPQPHEAQYRALHPRVGVGVSVRGRVRIRSRVRIRARAGSVGGSVTVVFVELNGTAWAT